MKRILAMMLTLGLTMCMGISTFADDSVLTLEQRLLVRASKVVFLNTNNYAAVSDGTLKWVDKNNKQVKPYAKGEETMVPLRFIAESVGADVSYNENRLVTITLDDNKLEFKVGENFYTLNGVENQMAETSEIVNNRTFVPLSVIADAFSKKVDWLENDRLAVISPTAYPWDKDNEVEKALVQEVKLMISPMVRDFAYVAEGGN